MKIQRSLARAGLAALAFLFMGCAGPEYYKDAIGKLTTSTNVIVEASDKILVATQDKYDEARLVDDIAKGKNTLEIPIYRGYKEVPPGSKNFEHVIARPAYKVLKDSDIAVRREFFATLQRTLTLLNKLADTDYGEAARKEVEGIGAKFSSIAGRFGNDTSNKGWKEVSSALGSFFEALIDAQREDAIRKALLKLTEEKGILYQLVALLRQDLYETLGTSLMNSLNEIRANRAGMLTDNIKSVSERRSAAVELRTAITDLLNYAALLQDYGDSVSELEALIPKIHDAAESPDFLAILQHTESLLVEAVRIKKDLDNIGKDEEAE